MNIELNNRKIIFGLTLIPIIFACLFFYFFDRLSEIRVNFGGLLLAISFFQMSLEKSPLSKKWNYGFLVFSILLYGYFLTSPFLDYRAAFGLNPTWYLIVPAFSYAIIFYILRYKENKKNPVVSSSGFPDQKFKNF